jgi:transposase
VKAAREVWHDSVVEAAAARLIFIDESGFSTQMARRYGYAPRGQRLVSCLPWGHYKTTTLVGGLTAAGLIAPMLIDGAMNSDLFAAYIDQVLSKETRPGDLVILDNLPAHETAAVRAAFARHGIAYLYLPPYSPDLNPIENGFSKLKRLLADAAERTVKGLWEAIGRAIDQFTPTECRNYFRKAGYAATQTWIPL